MNHEIYNYEQLKGLIIPLMDKYNASNALLFGSYARNEATANSDIDLVIVGGENFEPTDIFAIAEELHILSGKPVDVYEMREPNVGSSFYNTIMKEGVKLQ